MERFVAFPFSMGSSCASQSSVDVVDNPSTAKNSKHDSDPSSSIAREGRGGGDNLSGMKMKNTIYIRIQRLLKSMKNISHFFVYKDEVDEEMEMEIGFPTDVKHVTHIGWDGSTNTNKYPLKKDCLWETFKAHPNQDQLFSSLTTSSISLKQFELAMAAQTNNDPHHASKSPTLLYGSSFHNPNKPTTTTSS